MTRSLLVLGLGVLVFTVGLVVLVRVSAHTPKLQTPARSVRSGDNRVIRPERARHVVTVTVDGLNFTFAPSLITVRAGTTITWMNRTASPHTVTSVVPRLFDVAIKGHGASRLTVRRPGTYLYYCALHPYMLGLITVRP